MSEASSRVRAVARVDAGPTRAAAPRLKRRPGYLGSIHVGQLVLIQAVLLAVLAALAGGRVVAAVVGVVGALVIFAATLRYKGRWWYEQRGMARRYRRQRRIRPDGPEPDPRLAALHWLAPGLTVRDINLPDGNRIGVGCDPAGWYAVIALG